MLQIGIDLVELQVLLKYEDLTALGQQVPSATTGCCSIHCLADHSPLHSVLSKKALLRSSDFPPVDLKHLRLLPILKKVCQEMSLKSVGWGQGFSEIHSTADQTMLLTALEGPSPALQVPARA